MAGRRPISIDDKLEKQQNKVIKAKAAYEAEIMEFLTSGKQEGGNQKTRSKATKKCSGRSKKAR